MNHWIRRVIPVLTFVFFLTQLMSTYTPSTAHAAAGKVATHAERSKNQILIKYKNAAKSEASKTGIKSKMKLKKFDTVQAYRHSKAELVEVTEGDDVDKIVKELAKDTNVAYAQPNYKLTLNSLEDTAFAQQWSLANNGQTINGQKGTEGVDIHAISAWDTTLGSPSVLVGVLDTGIDVNHPDLKDSIYQNPNETAGNGVDDDNNGYVDDVNGWDFAHDDATVFDNATEDKHGTHIAGIIAASTHAQGIRGIAPNVKIVPLKFISGTSGYTSDAIAAIEYAQKLGVKIVNASFGSPSDNAALKDAMANSSILFLCAAGNNGQDSSVNPVYPANFGLPNVISVAAVDNQGNLASFSNYGTHVDIAAPGVSIFSTIPNNSYGYMSGTSMATAEAAGVAALIASMFPDMTAAQMATRLKQSVTPLASLQDVVNADGILNAALAVDGTATTEPSVTPNPTPTPTPASSKESESVTTLAVSVSPQLQEQIHYGETGVNAATGNFAEKFTDASINTPGFTINISRSYNAKDTRIGPLGRGWIFGFEGSLKDDTTNPSLKLAKFSTGEVQVFVNNSGIFTANDSHSTLVKLPDNTFQLTTHDQVVYMYNTNGYLVGMKDINGNVVQIAVDVNGKPQTLTDTVGRIYTVNYNAAGFIASVINPMGNAITYGYDANNNLNKVTDPLNNVVANYAYDTSFYLTQVKDGSNNVLETIAYDHSGGTPTNKVSTYKDKYGMTSTYTYTSGTQTTITDQNNRSIIKTYDAQFFTTNSQDPEGRQTIVVYSVDSNNVNKYGEQLSVTDRQGNKTQYQWDANGNIKTVTNPDSSAQSYTYDPKNNNQLSAKDEMDNMTYYTYDSNGNVLQIAQPLNGKDEFKTNADPSKFAIKTYNYYSNVEAAKLGYKTKGLLKSVTDPEGNVTVYTYDANGNQVSITDPSGNITTQQFNVLGWMTVSISPRGLRTEITYDANGRLERNVYDGGQTERIVYDIQGRKVQEITPNQYIGIKDGLTAALLTHTYADTTVGTRNTYYYYNKVNQETDAAGNITSYQYDLYGNVLTKTLPNRSQYVYTYDVMNRQTSTSLVDADQNGAISLLNKTAYAILPNGNLQTTETTYFNANDMAVTIKTYDYANRLIMTQYPDGTQTSTIYNANGTIQAFIDARGSKTVYGYDGLKRITDTWAPVTATQYNYSGNSYNRAGQKLAERVGKDRVTLYSVPADDRTIMYKYAYTNGLLVTETNALGGTTNYSYDKDNFVIKKDTQADKQTVQSVEMVNNLFGKPLQVKLHIQAGDLADQAFDRLDDRVLTTSNTYDSNGNLLTQTTADGVKATMVYDVLNRQTSNSRLALGDNGMPVLANTAVTYDWRGNKLTETDANGNITTYNYNTLGFLVKKTDAMGGTWLYDVDWIGRRLTQVSPQNAVNGQSIYSMNRTEYSYDLMGRLKAQTEKYNERAFQSNLTWGINAVERVSKAYQYDSNGNVIKELDGEGYRFGNGSSVDARIASGYGTNTRYDLSNHIIEVLQPQEKANGLAFSLKFDYDGAGRKITETTPDGVIQMYRYDDGSNIIQTTVQKAANVPVQVVKTNIYDVLGRLISEIDGNGNETNYTYNTLGKLRTTVLPGDASLPSDELHFQYDVMGQLQKKTDVTVQIMYQYTYDYNGRQISMTESTVNGKDSVTQLNRYDLLGNKRFTTNGNGNTTETLFDVLNRATTVKTTVTDTNDVQKEETVNYTYDKNGNKLTQSDWISNTTTFTYDAINRLIETVDANQVSTQKLVYNLNDAQVLTYDAYNNVTKFSYDRDNRQTSLIDAEGNIGQQTFDANGWVASKTDGNGNLTTYIYDLMGHLASVTDALGVTTGFTNDLNGNLLSQTNGNGHTLRFEYNARNLLLRKIDDGGRSGTPGHYTYQSDKIEVYTYTPDGFLASKTDRNGNTIQYTYDVHGRLTNKGVKSSNSEIISNNISFSYDNNGNRLSMQDEIGTSLYGYDERNRLITAYHPGLGTDTVLRDQTTGLQAGYSSDYLIDAKGNKLQRTYDKVNRLAQVQAGSATTSYTYFNNGNQQSVLYSNGVQETYGYYKNNLLKTLTNTLNGTTKDNYSYIYDSAGNQTSKYEITQGAVKGTTSFTYDALNRLNKVTEPNGKLTDYTYDAAGNRQTQKVTTGANIALTSYSYNEQNRMISSVAQLADGTKDTTSYAYDGNGNMIRKVSEETKLIDPANSPKAHFGLFVVGQPNTDPRVSMIVEGSANYQYDAWNQLVSAKTGNGTSTYRYDGDGQRAEKVTNGQTTRYIYQDGKVELEVDEKNRQLAWNVQGLNLISRTSGTDTMYYTYNGHADVTALIDPAGQLRTTFDYDAFGNPDTSRTQYYDAGGNPTTSAGRIDSPFRYAGYQYDGDTDLYYLNARYYDAETARFITEDTYGGNSQDPLSLNRYSYTHNEPIMYTDPTGHWEKNDEKLNVEAQAKIIALTSAYYNAQTAAEKKAIQAQAVAVRTDPISTKAVVTPLVFQTNAIVTVLNNAKNGQLSASSWNTATVNAGINTTTSTSNIYSSTVSISTTTTTTIGRTNLAVASTSKPIEQTATAQINLSYNVTANEAKFITSVADPSISLEQALVILDTLKANDGTIKKAELQGIGIKVNKGFLGMGGTIDGIEMAYDFSNKGMTLTDAELMYQQEVQSKNIEQAFGILAFGLAGGGLKVGSTRAAPISSVSTKIEPVLSSETYYRTMSKEDFSTFVKTGKIPATKETFISPTKSFSDNYEGVTVQISVKGGTTDSLVNIGVRDSSKLTSSTYNSMPSVTSVNGWTSTNAYFKKEGKNQINIGLGKGKALDTFNSSILSYQVVGSR